MHIGYTDLPSRMAAQSSFLYANNISKFLLSIGAPVYFYSFCVSLNQLTTFAGEKDHFNINLEDEVTRGAIVLHQGKLLWPPPAPKSMPAPPPPKEEVSPRSRHLVH